MEYIHDIGLAICFSSHLVLSQSDFFSPRIYVLNLQPLTWDEANRFCQDNGGHLAKVYDISTIPDLQLTQTLPEPNLSFWIGLSQGDVEGWFWADNTTLTWENWNTTDTVIQPAEARLCATASDTYPSSWRIDACTRTLPSLCQYEGGKCSIIAYFNHGLLGHNSLYLYGKTAEECKQVCLTEPSIFCMSFEHSPTDNVCQFNTDNRWTHPDSFTSIDGWNYYHKTCSTGEIIKSNLTVTISSSFSLEPTTSTSYVMPCSPVVEEINVTVTTTRYSTVTSTVTHFHMISVDVNDTTDPIEELQEMQVVLKKKRKQRTKKSRKDKRPSATYVGYVAITFLSFVFGSIILFDLHTMWVNATSKKKRRLKGKYNVLGALVSRTMKTDETNVVNIIERDKYEGFSSDNNNSLKETNSKNVNQAFSFASDPVFETERNGSMTAVPVPVPRQGQLLWKQLWPGFQKAYERQDHDSGTESDVSGER